MSRRTKTLLLVCCFGLLILVFVALSVNKERAVEDVGSKHSDANTNIQLINNTDGLSAVSYLGTHNSITSLSVSSVAPEGRQNAVEWIIEDAGYDMTTTRVIFEDFVNPFGDGDKKDDYEL